MLDADCYVGTLSETARTALIVGDPLRYATARPGDVLVTSLCASQQIDDLANQIRMLEAR